MGAAPWAWGVFLVVTCYILPSWNSWKHGGTMALKCGRGHGFLGQHLEQHGTAFRTRGSAFPSCSCSQLNCWECRSSKSVIAKRAMAAAAAPPAAPRVLNINVGVLGHVDSGKTSLVAALSTMLSTAALDKHPQSKERGITLDLGFSSFSLGGLPPHLAHLPYDELQFTLVDCPGHASLIRTIIGGIQIIDMMVLVIDVTKGLQAQTAECLVVAEVATPCMIIALNKIDLVPEQDRAKTVRKAAKRLAQTLQMTKFAMAPMVAVAAKVSGPKGAEASPSETEAPAAKCSSIGMEELKMQMVAMVAPNPRPNDGPFLLAIDHCFPIKGQGTVMTGTVLQGVVSQGDTIELPALGLQRGVRSIQAFKRPVTRAVRGDRVGVCVAQLDAKLLERGLAAAPGTVPTFTIAVASVEKIRFYAGRVTSGSKLHISVGHETTMAEVQAFGVPDGEGVPSDQVMQALVDNMARLAVGGSPAPFSMSRQYLAQEELYGLEGRPMGTGGSAPPGSDAAGAAAGVSGGAGTSDDAGGAHALGPIEGHHHGPQWLLLKFEKPVTAPRDALVIGARFDVDAHGEACRLAFYGRLVQLLEPQDLHQLKVYKVKERRGVIERVQPDGTTAVCRGLFKKETDISVFVGLKVTSGRGEVGAIESAFGLSGKFKVSFPGGIAVGPRTADDNVLLLQFKRYLHDPDKRRRPKQ